ncbi:hypothetical protein ACPA9J_30480 [Pseudomonas aeruginosa]
MHLSIFTCNAEVSLVQLISLHERLLKAPESLSFSEPTPVQAAAIPKALEGATCRSRRRPAAARPRPSCCRCCTAPAGRGQAALPGARADPPADPRAGPADPQGSRALRPVHLHSRPA